MRGVVIAPDLHLSQDPIENTMRQQPFDRTQALTEIERRNGLIILPLLNVAGELKAALREREVAFEYANSGDCFGGGCRSHLARCRAIRPR